jgi:hypothetical protein
MRDCLRQKTTEVCTKKNLPLPLPHSPHWPTGPALTLPLSHSLPDTLSTLSLSSFHPTLHFALRSHRRTEVCFELSRGDDLCRSNLRASSKFGKLRRFNSSPRHQTHTPHTPSTHTSHTHTHTTPKSHAHITQHTHTPHTPKSPHTQISTHTPLTHATHSRHTPTQAQQPATGTWYHTSTPTPPHEPTTVRFFTPPPHTLPTPHSPQTNPLISLAPLLHSPFSF